MSRFCVLLLLLLPVGDGKEVHTLSLPKYLTGCAPSLHRRRWQSSLMSSALTAGPCGRYWKVAIDGADGAATGGHLEFGQDPADRNALVAEYFETSGAGSSRRQIREAADDGGAATALGRVYVRLDSPTSGTVSFRSRGADESDELLRFSFSPNGNMLHTARVRAPARSACWPPRLTAPAAARPPRARPGSQLPRLPQGPVLSAAEDFGWSAFQATIVAGNHFQLTGFGSEGDAVSITSLSARKGVPDDKRDSFLTKWGPSAGIFLFFIASKLLKKKYGKGSDYTKERQSMPKPRTMPAPKKEKTAEDKKKQ